MCSKMLFNNNFTENEYMERSRHLIQHKHICLAYVDEFVCFSKFISRRKCVVWIFIFRCLMFFFSLKFLFYKRQLDLYPKLCAYLYIWISNYLIELCVSWIKYNNTLDLIGHGITLLSRVHDRSVNSHN